mmetsp:Transcript_26035/g.51067  ORF Transcript_26035/g.51067 Transcript_26035/m.51067 type:complete len:254 (+) Transcript_26035:310-1071(+)
MGRQWPHQLDAVGVRVRSQYCNHFLCGGGGGEADMLDVDAQRGASGLLVKPGSPRRRKKLSTSFGIRVGLSERLRPDRHDRQFGPLSPSLLSDCCCTSFRFFRKTCRDVVSRKVLWAGLPQRRVQALPPFLPLLFQRFDQPLGSLLPSEGVDGPEQRRRSAGRFHVLITRTHRPLGKLLGVLPVICHAPRLLQRHDGLCGLSGRCDRVPPTLVGRPQKVHKDTPVSWVRQLTTGCEDCLGIPELDLLVSVYST